MSDTTFPFEDVEIRSPETLRRIIKEIHRLMDAGEMEHSTAISIQPCLRPHGPIDAEYMMKEFPQYPQVEPVDFRSLPSDGPWPDLLYGAFRPREGQWFDLTVETYHGSGGRWRQVPK